MHEKLAKSSSSLGFFYVFLFYSSLEGVRVIKSLSVAFFSVLLTVGAVAETAKQADSLVDAFGVNTHMAYTNTAYASQWPQVLKALENLHVRHIRDGFYPWAAGSPLYAEHQQLHARGVDCDYVVATLPTVAQVATVQDLSGDMGFLEAPDELDDQKGANWVNVLREDMPALYGIGRSLKVPVIGPSLTYQSSYAALGDVGSYMNYNSLHVYFGGRNPGSTGWGSRDVEGHAYGSTAWWLDNALVDAPGIPSIVSETGYISNATVTAYTVPQTVEAKYAPRTLLEMFNAGIVKSYAYELADESQSPGYGLMTSDLRPKLAYKALSNLLGILQDPGEAFSPGSLAYTLTGAASDLHHLLLQKRDGTFYLALWVEASSYNPATTKLVSVPSQKVELSLSNAGVQELFTINDDGTVTTQNVRYAPTRFSLPVGDTVTLVQIVPYM